MNKLLEDVDEAQATSLKRAEKEVAQREVQLKWVINCRSYCPLEPINFIFNQNRTVRDQIEQERRNQEVQLRELRSAVEGGLGTGQQNTGSSAKLQNNAGGNRGNHGSQRR